MEEEAVFCKSADGSAKMKYDNSGNPDGLIIFRALGVVCGAHSRRSLGVAVLMILVVAVRVAAQEVRKSPGEFFLCVNDLHMRHAE